MHGPEGSFPGDEPSHLPAGKPSHPPYVEIHNAPPPSGEAGDAGDGGFVGDAIRQEQKKGHRGLIGGLVIIGAGILMIVSGVTGSVDFVLKSGGTSLHITTAVIGAFVCVIGLAVIIFTDSKVKLFFAKKA
jgi:hypothetical protein